MDMVYSRPLGPRLRTGWREGVERLTIMPRRSWKVVGLAAAFLLFEALKNPRWVGDAIHQRSWFDDGMILFWTAIWLTWLVAAVGEFFGTEIVSVERGELIIRPGIGRLRRTFRYPVQRICELVGVDPSVDGKGKGHLHHIFLKPKAGAVRFEFGDNTIHFANWLDDAEGDQIVRWLKPKLPASALAPQPYLSGGAANFRP